MSDTRSPGRRLWDRIEGSEVSDGSKYFTMANPAKARAFERVGAEIVETEEQLKRAVDTLEMLVAEGEVEPALQLLRDHGRLR